MKKPPLVLFLLLFSGLATPSVLAAPASVLSWQKQADGITFQLSSGRLRLQVCAPRVIHVAYAPIGIFPLQRVPVVVAHYAPVPFQVSATTQTVTLETGQVLAQVNRGTGAVSFRNAAGNVILSEMPGGRSMTPVTLAGPTPEAAFQSEQDFFLPPGEGVYGLGQHQNHQGAAGQFGSLDYRGKTVTLEQDYIDNLAIPFLVSSRGYGLLWNNPASTTVSVGTGPDASIPPAQLLTADGKPGGLTAQYYQGVNFDTLAATRTDPTIDFNWTTSPPASLPHDHYSIRWTGFVQVQAGGDYTFVTNSDDGVRLWVDDKPLIDAWNVHAAQTDTATVHFDAGSRHKIRMEYFQDQFDAVVRLAWRLPTESSALSWKSEAADAIDYYFFYGPSLDTVLAEYRQATGEAPLPPKWGLGFWQSRERYGSQQEWMDIAEGYRSRQEPIDNLVQDWFYWDPFAWGSHQFDPKRYPDPAAGIQALHDKYHLHLMISVWGKFDQSTPAKPDANYDALNAKGYLYPPSVRKPDQFYDAFNPEARALYWQMMRDAIFSKGVDAWWLDASEPEVNLQAFRLAPTAAGLGAHVLNAWPLMHTTGVYQGQRAAAPNQRVFVLTRSGFAGQQRNGAAIWSSDITGTWDVFAHQVTEGQEMALSGIPYWTTDIGGFFVHYPGGSANPDYRELFTRWFEWGAFCPIFRVHGTDTSKELWRFGPQYEPILTKYDTLRYRLLPYLYSQAWQVTHNGSTITRPLVMDFPGDAAARERGDEFLFGPAVLVCPVTTPGAVTRSVYLPSGATWTDFWTGQTVKGGQLITAPAPIDTLPLYVRAGSILPLGPDLQYTSEKPADPIELRVYPGANGAFTLYEDEGVNYNYERGLYATIPITWNESARTLTIGKRQGVFPGMLEKRTFHIVWVTPGHGTGLSSEAQPDRVVSYQGNAICIQAHKP